MESWGKLKFSAILVNAPIGLVAGKKSVKTKTFRAESDRCPAIIGKDHKRRARGAEKSVIGNTVHDRAHAVFADPETDVATTRGLARKIPAVLDVVQGRSMKIGAAAD